MRRIGISLVVLAFLAAQLVVVLSVPRQVSAYTPHAPIFISGNSNFTTANGVTGGNGTPGNPFMIEGWEINASTADGIKIQNTDAYFVIRSVFVHYGFSNFNGVTLTSVSNGQVDNSTISENRYGLYLTATYSIAVLNSTITNNDCGIEATPGTQYTTISGNDISGNVGIGALIGSSYVAIEANTFSYNGYEGLFLNGVGFGTVKNNQVFNNSGAGIDSRWGVYGVDIIGNTIHGNSWGISLSNSTQAITVAYNDVSLNLNDGIRMIAPAYNVTVAYNNITWNYIFGMLLQGATLISVHHNNFIGNQYQANDSMGTSNVWDNGCNSGGNYWSDYTGNDNTDCKTGGAGTDGFGDAPYVLDSDSQDNYPFMVPLNLTLNMPPTVTVVSPNGGESWAGGSIHPINWSMSDDADTNLTVWIKYSANGGAGWIDIPGAQNMYLPVGNQSFSWTVPQINTSNALVRVIVMDSANATGSDQSDGTFTIYPTAPYIVMTNPADGETNVPLDAPIVVAFSEPMNRSTVMLTMTPMLSFTYNWTMNDTLFTLQHTMPFSDCTMYTVSVNGKDLDGYSLVPGPVPNPWSFTTGCPNPTILNTDPASGQTNVALDAPIFVNFSEPMNTSSVHAFIAPYITLSESWSMNDTMVTYDHATPFAKCVNYTVNITGEDTSGYPLIPGPVPNPWMFSTCSYNPPSVSLFAPVGGEDWTGGYVKALSWNVTDPDDPLSNITTNVWYSTNGGSSWTYVAGLPGTTMSYDWLVPSVNTTAAKVKVCATDPTNNTGCDSSSVFTIDSASPQVTSTLPPSGAADVPLNQTVAVYWDEVMDVSRGAFNFTPAVLGSSNWSAGKNLVWFWPTSLLSICTNYSVSLTGFADDSDPGNTMAAPYSFSFMTYCPGPPSLSLLTPVGGEYWAGGSTQRITWSVTDDNTPPKNITIFINYTSSVSSGPIVGPIRIVTSYLWAVPVIDATDVKVNITAIDGDGMQSWDESGNFTIDSTPPTISSYSPTGWNVPLDAQVQVGFSEPVDAVSGQMGIAFGLLNEDASRWVAVNYVRIPSMWPQEVHLVPKQPLPPCNTYRALVNSTFIVDRASWALSTPGNWTFDTVCAPTATFLTSLTGKDWSGRSNHDFSWTMGDEIDTQLRVWLNYSTNGGADSNPYSFFTGMKPKGTNIYTWTLPAVDSTNARVRVTVIDSSGLKATADSAVFTIDSTPPSILSSVPNEGVPGVTITDDIQVVFSEAVVRSTAQSGFSISPNPTGLTFAWQTLPSGKDMLVVGHKPLKSKMDYTVSFSTVLRDVSDPGNNASAALTIHFSTKPPPPGIPPIAKAVGKNQVEVGEPVTFDGSGSIGTNLTYIWTITDNQQRIVDVLAGRTVTFTFTDNGRYKVTLMVIDRSTGLPGHDSIEIVVTSGSNAGTLILLSSAIIVGAAIGGTEAGRVALFMLLAVPVYRRKMKGKEDSETRGMVKGYILVHPGDTYTEIKQNLRLQNGSLTWHLMKLEKEGVIKSKVQGTRRKYYPSSMPLPMEDGGELHEIEKQMLRIVKSDPGMTVKVLAEELGVSSQLALYHLRKLSQKGLLSLERRGLRLKVFIPPKQNA